MVEEAHPDFSGLFDVIVTLRSYDFFIKRALDNNSYLIQVKSLDDAIALTNRLAPEHCEVMTRNPRKVSEGILTTGAIFLGPRSPAALGDYSAGPSHVLPTDRTWDVTTLPYIFTGDLTVPQGKTLHIKPGAVLKFDNGQAFVVNGHRVLNSFYSANPGFKRRIKR